MGLHASQLLTVAHVRWIGIQPPWWTSFLSTMGTLLACESPQSDTNALPKICPLKSIYASFFDIRVTFACPLSADQRDSSWPTLVTHTHTQNSNLWLLTLTWKLLKPSIIKKKKLYYVGLKTENRLMLMKQTTTPPYPNQHHDTHLSLMMHWCNPLLYLQLLI